MNLKMKAIAASTVALGACLGFSGTAEAVALTTDTNVKFNFWQSSYTSGYQASSIAFNSASHGGKYTLTATANQGKVHVQEINSGTNAGYGLGVVSSTGDNTQIDGNGHKDALFLTLGNNWIATLVKATFSRIGTDDDGVITVDGKDLWAASLPGGNRNETEINEQSFTSLNASKRTGNVFGFSAPGADDDYYLKYVYFNISQAPTQAVQPPKQSVPEPLTILGTVTAAALGAGMKRKLAAKAE